jgi:hypothetical protein
MDDEKRNKSTTTNGMPPEPGFENAPAPGPVTASGQNTAYWVLNEEERKKGWVRPLRRAYIHAGIPAPKTPLIDLTKEEHERYDQFGYIKFEPNPDYPEKDNILGRYWTQKDLDKVGKGCGTKTTMGLALCETYARDPSYYGSTFCCGCGTHLPVNEFRWAEDGEIVGS